MFIIHTYFFLIYIKESFVRYRQKVQFSCENFHQPSLISAWENLPVGKVKEQNKTK